MLEEMRRRLLLGGMVYAADEKAGATDGDKSDKAGDGKGGDEKPEPKTAAKSDDDEGGDDEDDGKAKSWQERRLDAEYGKRQALQRENAALTARITALEAEKQAIRKGETVEDDKGNEKTRADIEAEIDQLAEQKAAKKAEEIAARREFDERSNAAYEDGAKAYKDWDKTLANFTKVGGIASLENDFGFISAALETENPAKVFYELAKNLDELQRIMDIRSPAKRIIELDRVARAKPKKQSEAPRPLDAVGGGGEKMPEGVNDELPIEEWMRRRDAEAKASGRRRLAR